MADERSRRAVEVAEGVADGLHSRTKWKAAQEAARSLRSETEASTPTIAALNSALAALFTIQKTIGFYEASDTANAVCYALGVAIDTSQLREQPIHAELVRDIFGNPFRPATIDPAWLTPTVTSLATAAYEERALPSGELDAARLAVLSDALEEAGCDNADILEHLRGAGPHVRGCWVVDLLLGKE